MDFNRLTQKSQEALGVALEDARKKGHPEVYPEHLGLALLQQDFPSSLLERAGVEIAEIQSDLNTRLSGRPSIKEGAQQQPSLATSVSELFDAAEGEISAFDSVF